MDKEKRPVPSSFTAFTFGELRPTSNPMISQARLALFYKEDNRNQSFFTSEMSDKLIARATGTPIVGHYDEEKGDFTQHTGKQAQKYGYIPQEHNFAWEERVDEDGVTRTYACFDVHLFTGRHPEAKQIIGKKQSMELDPDSISGQWRTIKGKELFVFEDALLSGCCVLGDDYEPCFEGSMFFSLQEKTEFIAYLNAVREGIHSFMKEALEDVSDELQIEGGKTQMKLNFGWAEDDARNAIVAALNPDFTEEKGWLISSVIISENADGSLLTYNLEKSVYEVYTSETNEEGEVVLTAVEDKYYDVIENGQRDALLKAEADLEAVNGEFATYKEEQEALIASLNEKNEAATAQIAELEAKVEEFTARDQKVEEARKTELIESYATLLNEEELQGIAADQANFTYDEIEAKLAVSYMREQRKEKEKVPAGNFTKNKNSGDELVALLSRYKK
jgi:hypothetical protein